MSPRVNEASNACAFKRDATAATIAFIALLFFSLPSEIPSPLPSLFRPHPPHTLRSCAAYQEHL